MVLRKTDTRTTPVTMNEPKHVCDLARAKGGGGASQQYIHAQPKDKRETGIHPLQTRNFDYVCYIVTIRHLAKKREDQ